MDTSMDDLDLIQSDLTTFRTAGNRLHGPLTRIEVWMYGGAVYYFDADEVEKTPDRFVFYHSGRRIGSAKRECVRSLADYNSDPPYRPADAAQERAVVPVRHTAVSQPSMKHYLITYHDNNRELIHAEGIECWGTQAVLMIGSETLTLEDVKAYRQVTAEQSAEMVRAVARQGNTAVRQSYQPQDRPAQQSPRRERHRERYQMEWGDLKIGWEMDSEYW